jgi:integrase/recombinase XerD
LILRLDLYSPTFCRAAFGSLPKRLVVIEDWPHLSPELAAVTTDRTRAIPLPQLEQLWHHHHIAVREKALWRFLYETAARASEALSINVEDLDVDNKRVRVRSKGGDLDWLHFQTGSARLLPRLIAGRTHGPLSRDRQDPIELSARRGAIPAGVWWMDPSSAAPLGPHPPGRAERQPAAAMAKSRHASLRSLQRYARPGAEAVAALTAATDPARRRR